MGDSGGQELEIQLEETQQQLDQAGLPPEGFTVDETCSPDGFHLHFRMAFEDSQNMSKYVQQKVFACLCQNVFSETSL